MDKSVERTIFERGFWRIKNLRVSYLFVSFYFIYESSGTNYSGKALEVANRGGP